MAVEEVIKDIATSPGAVIATSLCIFVGLHVGRMYWATRSCSSDRPHAHLSALSGFQLEEVLKDEDDGRVVNLLGRFNWQEQDQVALVKLTATPLSLNGLLRNIGQLSLKLKNDSGAQYAFYDCAMSPWKIFMRGLQASSYSLEVVAPASEKVVNRHRAVPMVMWTETPEMYATVTEPYLDKVLGNGNSLSWLYNVLSKEKEADRVLYEDDDEEYGFLMNVDTKWRTHPDVQTVPREQWRDHPSVTDLYCLGICHRRDIRTIRDLRATHLPMLRALYTQGVKTIKDVYGVPEDQLRVFVHYMPQFFHFHVHFTRVNNTIGVEAEKAHLLQDIIQNLEMDNSFYQERKMQFRLHENDALHLALKVDEERPREE